MTSKNPDNLGFQFEFCGTRGRSSKNPVKVGLSVKNREGRDPPVWSIPVTALGD